MDEEEDSIVQEIPVFLSQTLAKQLYVFQYPVRPATAGWEDTTVLNCKIKPLHQQVKLEFGLDTESERYNSSKGEEIALNTDGHQSSYLSNKEKDKNVYFKSGAMDKLLFESESPITDASKYCVAILQDGEMHLTPLHGIVQLRPGFTYFDKQDKRAKDEEKEKSDVDDEAGTSSEPEVKQVTVSFARTETDRSKKARESSFGYLSKKSSEEPWCDSTWWHSNSDKAELERSKLFACSTAPAGDALSLSTEAYLAALVPVDEELAASAPGVSGDVINLNDLKKLPLVEQCKVLLKDAKLVTVGWAASVLGVWGAPLLAALAGAGRLLRGGRWAARSSLLYPAGRVSQHAGVSDMLMCRARDYVLYLFTQSQYVNRRKVTAAVKLPPEEVKEILSSVARLQPKGWELLIPPDPDFETKYPDIEQRQALFWDARQRQFNEMLSGESSTPKRQRKKSQRDSVSSDGGMPSPKVKNLASGASGNSVVRESSVSSDNESGSDSKKLSKKNLQPGGCLKRTKLSAHSNFNSGDNGRVS